MTFSDSIGTSTHGMLVCRPTDYTYWGEINICFDYNFTWHKYQLQSDAKEITQQCSEPQGSCLIFVKKYKK